MAKLRADEIRGTQVLNSESLTFPSLMYNRRASI
jgi:hypothetical protein